MKKNTTLKNKAFSLVKIVMGSLAMLGISVIAFCVVCLSTIAFPVWYVKKKLTKNEKEREELEEFKLTRRR